MKLLVIGGTRFIGAAVVRRLVEDGHQVAVLTRGQSPYSPPAGVHRIQGDRDCLAESRAAIAAFAPAAVLHNVVAVERHAREAVDLLRGLCGRLIMTSSCDVYRAYGRLTGSEPGPPDPTPLDETSPLRESRFPYRDRFDPGHPLYDYDKIPAEEIVLGERELPGTVLRLPMVLGPQDYQHRLFGFFRPMLDDRPSKVMQSSYAVWRSTYGYVENVAYAMAAACVDERAKGRTYNIADWNLSMLEQIELLRPLTGWKGALVLLPKAELPESLHADLDPAQPLVCSAQRIREELNLVPPVSLEECFARTFAWERENPPDPIPANALPYEAEDAALERWASRSDRSSTRDT